MLQLLAFARRVRSLKRRGSWPALRVILLGALFSRCAPSDSASNEPGIAGGAAVSPDAASMGEAPASGASSPPGGIATTPAGSEGPEDVSLPTGGLGSADGGRADAGGSAVPTCELPASFRWTSSPPLLDPQARDGRAFASIKDPSIVFFEGEYHVFATVYETTAGAAGYKSVYLNFNDFAQAGGAAQTDMSTLATGSAVAPQIFYFAPHGLWYLIYQWGARYSTNADIGNPDGWSAPQPLLAGEPPNALDFWVICDDVDCHLFFSRDDGVLYKSKTPIGSFPSFSGYDIVMSEPSPGLLFEASNVYAVDGTNQYLLMVEAYGPRYFRSWTAESLDGPWTPLADTQQNPFAGAANVAFEGERWSDDISHGEMIRSGYDQRLAINACKMRYLYQGTAPGFQGAYDLIPYRLGLLTQQ